MNFGSNFDKNSGLRHNFGQHFIAGEAVPEDVTILECDIKEEGKDKNGDSLAKNGDKIKDSNTASKSRGGKNKGK